MTYDERISGCFIIDPGASSGFSSIAAAEQIQVQRVCANEPGLPQIVDSDKSFKLADGNNAGTGSKVLQPITAGLLKGQTVELNLADVSSTGTAPLYPISELKKNKVIIDYDTNELCFKSQPDVWHPVPTTSKGLMLLPVTQQAVERFERERNSSNSSSSSSNNNLPHSIVSKSSINKNQSHSIVSNPINSLNEVTTTTTEKVKPDLPPVGLPKHLLSPSQRKSIDQQVKQQLEQIEKDVAYLWESATDPQFYTDVINVSFDVMNPDDLIEANHKSGLSIQNLEVPLTTNNMRTIIPQFQETSPQRLCINCPSKAKNWRELLVNSLSLCTIQNQNGGYYYIVDTETSPIWTHPQLLTLINTTGYTCLKDQYVNESTNHTEKELQCTFRIFTNDERFVQQFGRTETRKTKPRKHRMTHSSASPSKNFWTRMIQIWKQTGRLKKQRIF